ncbi:hypothetical protein ACS0TY_020739 [Phlomoides rotata]
MEISKSESGEEATSRRHLRTTYASIELGEEDSSRRQPSTSGVKEGEIRLRPQKGPKRVDTNIKGVNHAGGLTIHGITYSKEWNSDQNTLSQMYLENIHDFGHSKERAPSIFIDGTDLEHSPQFVLLHQVSGKSQNFQIGC